MAGNSEKTVGKTQRQGKTPSADSATRPTGKIEDFFGFLAGKTTKVATMEEIAVGALGE